jgi:hypothetical protein
MIHRKSSTVRETKFERSYELAIGEKTILPGEIIKVSGEHGAKFKFISVVTNKETGTFWVDCFEITGSQVGAFRSFSVNRIKTIPKKRLKK